jgi:hypothetical protein
MQSCDTEQSLAFKLSAPGRHTLLCFLSPTCGLCHSLAPALIEVPIQTHMMSPMPPGCTNVSPHACTQAEQQQQQQLALARLDASQSAQWAPEVSGVC